MSSILCEKIGSTVLTASQSVPTVDASQLSSVKLSQVSFAGTNLCWTLYDDLGPCASGSDALEPPTLLSGVPALVYDATLSQCVSISRRLSVSFWQLRDTRVGLDLNYTGVKRPSAVGSMAPKSQRARG